MSDLSKDALAEGSCSSASFAVVALLTSLAGFTIHVVTVDVIQKWLFGAPAGMSYSRSVTALAAITSLEVGIGLTVLYRLIRPALQKRARIVRVLILTTVLLAIQGILVRQLLMDQIVGGIRWQSLVSDMLRWPTWLGMCFVLVWTYEWFTLKKRVDG